MVPIKFIQQKVHKYTLLLGEITAIKTGKRQGCYKGKGSYEDIINNIQQLKFLNEITSKTLLVKHMD